MSINAKNGIYPFYSLILVALQNIPTCRLFASNFKLFHQLQFNSTHTSHSSPPFIIRSHHPSISIHQCISTHLYRARVMSNSISFQHLIHIYRQKQAAETDRSFSRTLNLKSEVYTFRIADNFGSGNIFSTPRHICNSFERVNIPLPSIINTTSRASG